VNYGLSVAELTTFEAHRPVVRARLEMRRVSVGNAERQRIARPGADISRLSLRPSLRLDACLDYETVAVGADNGHTAISQTVNRYRAARGRHARLSHLAEAFAPIPALAIALSEPLRVVTRREETMLRCVLR